MYQSGKCIVCKVYMNSEKCFLTCLNRSPAQNWDQFESSSSNLSVTLSNIYVEIPTQSSGIGCFKRRYTKCTNWWRNEKIISAGIEIVKLALMSGYFNKKTYIIYYLYISIIYIY